MPRASSLTGFTPLHPENFNFEPGDEWQIIILSSKKIHPRGRGVMGFAIMEIVVALGILSLATMAIGAFTTGIFRYNRTLTNQMDAEIQLRKIVAQFTTESRTASASSLGAYPIDTATASAIIFYANIDADNLKERVRYFLDSGSLNKGIIKPSGFPLTYNPLNETVVSLVNDVTNSDIFFYYDETFNGSSPPLSFPVTITVIRLVHLKISVDRNINEPPGPIEVQTNVHLRNL
ncbi:hypothetical protein A3H10_04495 [Candidatus Uhrbacteria bacterium RIFCSPLOWO2_12_FULL_46_10]|uniref:Type II secretion system protein J n=1 Tax=Candidatus Uhrbacteria bacterium RIFCSPLOWO2_01_FULL_47_25 TaxID=1802402 RepID=A0A1F7UXV2_9BACT|nr:MAG: hypothetical protein A2752_05360 [Candidatus Uhrbacteria bacterium RIFCSPHIGHO2_01_FULL_46_23]OGL68992.1 MAG: hypothetical protein A3D60_04415 [Candidatus Uhrbacteria bacterium RIFCSPHIGHO2_02_FULL_47_29]OGL76697.1 MAG: hypothetical protein A3E96_00785 [Candidatus Uhrbacteria bacterium RIFCSPHIGHO2_12_FULL_46_13]OGL82497.1 MAG: hypothetical protein A2936_02465 [Candidatus Uhrbacteria bacterium RIFCSPLOWO2_01_FULL_47_25]OGL85931.1 MAG: hypothetical protein A3I37_01070 [Candidatus Uhrbact